MQQTDPSIFFDEAQAASYDERFARLAPLREALDLLARVALSGLPAQARILCVGAGTGAEVLDLAARFPGWRFMAVEPSGPMLEVCRRRLEERGLSDRCEFHHGFVESLPASEPFDAATSILVSHFILSSEARARFFRTISGYLRHGGYLINADLSYDTASPAYPPLLEIWLQMMRGADVPAEEVEKFRETYRRDVALWPPEEITALIEANGFGTAVRFFQAGLIHGWFARRS